MSSPATTARTGTNGTVLAGRIVAIAVAVPTFVTLFLRDNVTIGNLFFVPDVLLCAILVVGAFLPARRAGAVLAFGFTFAAGVITTAVFDYVARDSFGEGLPTLVVALACLVMAVLLIARLTAPRVRPAG
ncbi:hypothetical protein SAMN05421630_10711 [Prauserella marina]|uniref:Uncharacterized protein n=1 Tax=Prauserella marina TaxID=530584 RepID=A0A1G6TAQ2_9PSEU|nr:hypothetical protein [Prauserella marina]PWV75811.1 hypothetical protein DES30_106430 [Prauserella marina]SDD25557.1 hypothetical protein SAMN05421630_10711 [Prauserella marina]